MQVVKGQNKDLARVIAESDPRNYVSFAAVMKAASYNPVYDIWVEIALQMTIDVTSYGTGSNTAASYIAISHITKKAVAMRAPGGMKNNRFVKQIHLAACDGKVAMPVFIVKEKSVPEDAPPTKHGKFESCKVAKNSIQHHTSLRSSLLTYMSKLIARNIPAVSSR